ncbi:hypothetical protein MACK_002494 [Theileria orientalis]|uniref:Uncharacterized protein n=1 Tax=Theileria orientalis TaxID=68886 RepID=A0A976MDD7_THEOR|nr:hypothetical protein MACK_002494 [Theileria orientalis]
MLIIGVKWVESEEEDYTIVLSTKQMESITSKELLDPIRKYDKDIYVIASVNVDGEKSGLTLDNEKFKDLGLPNLVRYKEDCVALHELLNQTFERMGFDFLENNDSLQQVESGLWLYLPVLKYTSLDDFKELFGKHKDKVNVTFLVTDCDLLKTKDRAKHVKKTEESTEDEIKTTPVIVQQTVVMIFFIIILALGMHMASKIKTPSSLLVPQQVKPKTS